MYYTTCGSGDFTNIDHVWLKTVRLQYSFIGVVLFQISHTNRENQLKPPITSLSKNALSWAGRSRNLTWSPHDVMVRQNLTNACTNFVTVLDKYAKGMLVLLSWWIEVALKSGVLTIHTNHPGGNLVHLTYITVTPTLLLLAGDLHFFASSPTLPLWYINLPLFTSTINIEYLVKNKTDLVWDLAHF